MCNVNAYGLGSVGVYILSLLLFCFLAVYCFPFLFGKLSICFKLGFRSCEAGIRLIWSRGPHSSGVGVSPLQSHFLSVSELLPCPVVQTSLGVMDFCVCPLGAAVAR